MGFGNYDESEQKNEADGSDIDTSGEAMPGQHNGEVTVEGADDTDALINQLGTIRENNDDGSETGSNQ